MEWLELVAAALAALVVAAALLGLVVLPFLSRRATGRGVPAVIWHFNRLYTAAVHHVRAGGCNCVPDTIDAGPLLVVCNHQSPVDPLLVQSQCRFLVHWLMAREYMIRPLGWVWRSCGVIPVDRDGKDSAALRSALRLLRSDKVVGVFPEGGIRPDRGTIGPFLEGVGVLAARGGRRVLLVSVDETPRSENMVRALLERSESQVRFIDLMTFEESMTAEAITDALRQRLAGATGWALVE